MLSEEQKIKYLAQGVNLGLKDTYYQVRLRKSDCLVVDYEGERLYRARSLKAAVNWIHARFDETATELMEAPSKKGKK